MGSMACVVRVGYRRNDRQEALTTAALQRTAEIPDEDVRVDKTADTAWVRSQHDRDIEWEVRHMSSAWAGCNCPMGRQGMVCKHQFKALKLSYG
jgi:hypothetical protein